MADRKGTFKTICECFATRLGKGLSLEEPLDALLTATFSRATGLWRVRRERLELLGFRAVPDMPEDVRRGFAEATATVSLGETGLGIVKAAVTRQPAVAYSDQGVLGGSVTWLQKFEAGQSLALPVLDGDRLLGVIAISAAERFGPESPPWLLMESVARGLGSLMKPCE